MSKNLFFLLRNSMIGFVFFVISVVAPFNVTQGDTYALPCPFEEAECFPDCKIIFITLSKDRQVAGSAPEKVYEWIKTRTEIIEEPEGKRYSFSAGI